MTSSTTDQVSHSAPTFSDFLSFEDFQTFIRLQQTEPEDRGEVHRAARLDAVDNIMKPALRGFLTVLKDRGVLEPIPGSEGRSSRFLDAWNAIATDSEDFRANPDRHWAMALHKFAHRLSFDAAYKSTGDEMDSRQRYEALIATVNKGDMPWWQRPDCEMCRTTDERLYVDVEGWKVIMGTLSPSGPVEFIPIQPISRPGVVEVEVELKTGNLLIADWIRIPEFDELVRSIEDEGEDDEPSINSLDGREARTRKLVERLGLVSVSVGNTCPSILQVDGTLVFGRGWDADFDDAPEGVTEFGMVCTDFWAVTVIERERLVEIVAETIGREEAERKVTEYVAKGSFVTQVSVEPGVHYLYFSGDEEGFAGNFRSPDLYLEGKAEPFLVLSPRRIRLEDSNETATPPAP